MVRTLGSGFYRQSAQIAVDGANAEERHNRKLPDGPDLRHFIQKSTMGVLKVMFPHGSRMKCSGMSPAITMMSVETFERVVH